MERGQKSRDPRADALTAVLAERVAADKVTAPELFALIALAAGETETAETLLAGADTLRLDVDMLA